MSGGASEERANSVLRRALNEPELAVATVERIDGGRGVFSEVERCTFADDRQALVIKHARVDANGRAALASGAYEREALAYRTILPQTPKASAPRHHGSVRHDDGRITFVLEDLTHHRAVDQLDGLAAEDVALIAVELCTLHDQWADPDSRRDVGLRSNTPRHLAPAGLAAGLRAVSDRWSLGDEGPAVFSAMAHRREQLVAAFASAGAATVCHGDPRADNVVFTNDRRAVLFDWQQMAVQFGEADLAWLLATSTTPEVRREIEADVIASYAIARRQDAATTWRRYRLGMILPGLAVLMLARRESHEPRTNAFIETSLRRVATALKDLDVAELGP